MARSTGQDKIDPSQIVTKNIITGIPEREKATDHIADLGASGAGKSRAAYQNVCQFFPKRVVIIDPLFSWHINTRDLPPGITPEIKYFQTVRGLIKGLDDKQKRIITTELIARKTGKKVPASVYHFIYVLKNANPDRLMLEFLYAKMFEMGHIHFVPDEITLYVSKQVETTKAFYRLNPESQRIDKMPSLFVDILGGGRHACLSTEAIGQDMINFSAYHRRQLSAITIFRQSQEGAEDAARLFTPVEREKYGKDGAGLQLLKDGEFVKIWKRSEQRYYSSQMAPGYRY